MSKVSVIYNHSTDKPHHSLYQLNPLSLTTHKRYRRSDSEQIESNSKLFNIIRKKNLTVEGKLEKLGKLFNKQPKPNINAQDGNDNKNTPLHLSIKKNELDIIKFILNQGADVTIKNSDGATPLELAEKHKCSKEVTSLLNSHKLIVGLSKTSELNTASEIQESRIPNDFTEGTALGGGDCFFDSLAQGMNKLSTSSGPLTVQSLRQTCYEYAKDNPDAVYDSRTSKTWRQVISEDANSGGYVVNGNNESGNFDSYLVGIQLTTTQGVEGRSPIWGRPEIEGRMLCDKFDIKLHVIEKQTVNDEIVTVHQLIDRTDSKSIDDDKAGALYSNDKILHILNEGRAHFIPVLPLEARPGNLDGLPASSDLSTGPDEPTNSAQDSQPPKDDQPFPDQFSHYIKTINLADKTILPSINRHLSNSNFRILKITAQTPQEALEFMQREEFYQAFNQASHWFMIAVEVGSLPDDNALIALKSKFTDNKPIILQWRSPSTSQLYYRNSGESDFSHVDLQSLPRSSSEEFITAEESFTFDKLLRALKANLGGQLSDNLLTATLDTSREFDTWHLIDYAARYKDSLSLRWFMLTMTDKDLTKKNSDQRQALEIAAEYATPECLSALLKLPFPETVTTEKWFLSSPTRELLELKNDLGNTPLMIAAEKGKVDNLQLFIRLGADIAQHNKNGDDVITLAWKNKHYNAVKQLLEVDSPFPRGFQEQDIADDKLKALISTRKQFHKALKEGAKDRVESFIKKYPQLKQAYDPSNQSALIQALNAEQYNIYAILQSQGYAVGIEEEQFPEEKLTEDQKQKLKHAKKNFFAKPEQSHITYLLSKSRLGLGQQGSNRFDEIKGLYESLDNIPEISTILRVVEQAKSLDIIFDFNHHSIIDIDPTQSAATTGACDYRRGRIYIGAKQDEAELRGTLAHELTHLAMQIRYHNDCNPYEALEEQKKLYFQKIVEEYQSKQEVDEVIKRVFTVYRECDWPAELVVRVHHLLAKYGVETGKDKLEKQASSLFTWYKEQIPSDLQAFINNPEHYKNQNQIQDLNQQLEQLDKIKELSKSIQLANIRQLLNKVTNEKKITLLSSSNPQLTLLNLYQQLAKSHSHSQLIHDVLVAQSSQFKNDLIAQNIFDAMQLPTHPWLIIDCTQQDVEAQKAVLSTLDSITSKQKIILIAPTTEAIEQQWKKFRKIDDKEYHWQDLTQPSQENILKRTANFQGHTVELQQLMSADSPVAVALPLANLLASEKSLEIGKPIPISYGYDTDFYIDRTLNQQITIKAKIFNDLKNTVFNDLVAKSQQEFEQLCRKHPNNNVHWLQEESGQWLWQKSQGGLTNLRKYIDTSQTRHHSHENAENRRVMLIADTAGMGKTTVLTHLSKAIKKDKPIHWVVRIDLNDYTDALKAQLEKTFTMDSAVKFISDKLLKLENPLEKTLFIQSFQSGEAAPLVLMFDGLDEISPSYKETVINLLTTLKSTAIKQLWVTTRPHLKEELEDKLQQLAYTLEPFSETDQINFLVGFWKKNLELSENQASDAERLQDYAQQLVRKLASSIKDRDREFTGIPLQTKMLAESFQAKTKERLQMKKDTLELPDKLELIDLYEEFIKEKYRIYQSEKLNKDLSNPGVQEEQDSIFENFKKTHQKLAMKSILGEEKYKDILTGETDVNISEEKIYRAGLVQVIDGKPHFVHRTFAEYFMADFIVEELKKEQPPSEKFQDLFLKEILLEDVHQVIRGFINGFLGKTSPKQEIFKQYGNKISKLFLSNKNNLCNSRHHTMLYLSVDEGNDTIVQFILECIKKIKNSEDIFYYLSNGPEGDKFVLHRAIFNKNLKIVKILVKNGADVEKTNSYGDTSLHYAVNSGYKDLVDFLIKSKDDDGGGSDVNAKDNLGCTALYISVDKDNLDIIESLMEKSDINHQDNYGISVLHNSIHSARSKEIVEKLVKRGVNVNVKDNDGLSVLHYAAYNGKLDVIKYLVEHGCDINLKSDDGSTILHEAALSGNINLCEWIVKRSPSLVNDKDINGRTPLHEAAERDRLNIIEFLEKEGGEIKSTDKHGNNLLLEAAKYSSKTTCEWFINKGFDIKHINEKGEAILHISIKYGNLEVVKWLVTDKGFDPNIKDKNGNPAIVGICKYVPEVNSEELIKRSFLSEDNIHYRKTWYPQETDVEIIRYLKYKVNFNDKDENGKTILHYAAEYDQNLVVKELVRPNNQGEIVSDITLKDNKEKLTALIWAAKGSHWDCVICLLNYEADIQDLNIRQCDLLKEYIEQSNNIAYNVYNKQDLLEKIKQRLSRLQVEPIQAVAEQTEQILEPMDVDKAGPSCRRRRRDLGGCGEEREGRVFPYEPWERVVSEESYHSQLHAQLALSLVWGHQESVDKWLRYQRYLGEIVEERVENQSPRERGLLRDHYQQALAFFAENPKNRLLQGVDDDFSPAIGESVFLQNGQHSWVVFNAGERYQLYSPDFNYRQRFQTRGGVSWSELSGFMRAFFTWKSGFGEYHPLVLASPLPGKALLQLQEALFWKPEAVAPDRVLLAVRQHGLIEGIPATTVRELISVKGKVVDWTALHADFFQTAGIQLRLDKLHQVLPELTEAQQRILGRLVNHYRWPADSTTLDNCSADERPVLADYQQRVMAELKQAETITPERLSELSWQALGQAIEEQPELPEELKQPVLDNLKAMHSTTTRRAWAKGMATQSLFFLPDMIRAANTGQVGGLAGTAGMLAADGGVNHLYGRLLERLAPTLGEARLGLLRKLPITSPVFKALTVYSIVELTKQLHSLPADSEQRKTIRHRLGEQYVTIGIMAAELLGLETGPLWIGLMAEQLIFEAITFRKENQLDIPFWEALIMSLGFEQNKLQHIVEERQLVDVNLATVDNINTQANPPYGWVLIKIPLLGPLVWTSLAESQIPRNISAEILQQPAPFSFDVATEVRESKGFRQVRQFKTRLYPAYNAAVATRGELIETQWQRGIYHATSASTRIDVVPIGPHCQEDNIFLDSPKGLVSYKRVASVMGDSYRFCPPHGPIKIKGPGLSALYANNQTFTNQNAQRNLYLGFDPCEGDITLHFFPAGLQQLDVINRQHNPQYSPDLNQPYSITIQVGHKNYPDSILFSQEGSLLTLNDPTRRINSHYFIDYDTRPFRIRDDATVTRVAFNPTQSLGYRLQSDGPEIIRLYPPQGDTFSTLWLKGPKQQLQLRLGQQRIANVLMLSAEQVEIFSAHGEDAYRSGIYLTNHVTRFALTVVGNVQIMQKQTHLFVIGEHPDNTPAIHYTKNPGMPYQLTLATLQPVVETLHRPNPQECHFTTPGILYSWLPGEQSTATLQIVGGYQGQLAQLLLERDNATLSQSAFHQPTRTLVVFHFTDSVALDHQLRLQQVLPANHTGPGLQFQSPQGDEVLHYFEHDRFTINGIHYQMHGKRLYATGAESGVIEGKQLIRDRHPGQGVGIRIHSSLNQSVLARDNQTWSINQLKLHQLPERTLIYFEHQTFPWQALQETPQHPHRHHHQSRHRRQIPNVASSAQRPTSWITNLWKGLLGRFPTDTRPSLPQPSVSLTPSEYTAEHLQGGLQLLDLVIRKWTGKKYSPPTLTIDFDTDDNRRTMASQLAYAAQCPTVTTLKQSLATENHESHATTPQEPWLAYPLPTTDTHNLTRQLT